MIISCFVKLVCVSIQLLVICAVLVDQCIWLQATIRMSVNHNIALNFDAMKK